MADPLRNEGPLVVKVQTDQARSDQVRNHAGGFGWKVTDHERVLRFLILGTEGGTYYASEKELTKDNASFIMGVASEKVSGLEMVRLLVTVSCSGRAPRQNPTLFALAACHSSPSVEVRRAATEAVPQVCRTATMLFTYLSYLKQFRGRGRLVHKALRAWYERPDKLGYQAVKYRQREGWTHRDVLRLVHPKVTDPELRTQFDWITHGTVTEPAPLPSIIEGYEAAQRATTAREWARLAAEYRLPWEALPDAALGEKAVWDVMLPNMGYTALLRNLGRMTTLELLTPFSDATGVVLAKLADPIALKGARVHPMKVLVAARTYASGSGYRGKGSWRPVPRIVDALDSAFYLAFGNLVPANKRTLVALDVSGSMYAPIGRYPLTAREAAAALAMVTLATEPRCEVVAFCHEMVPLDLTPSMRLSEVLSRTAGLNFGATDCALPFIYAGVKQREIDTFITITDNDTWSGVAHPFQALGQYRSQWINNARSAVCALTATEFTIADPNDPGMLDCVGFDTATPDIIRGFSAGEF